MKNNYVKTITLILGLFLFSTPVTSEINGQNNDDTLGSYQQLLEQSKKEFEKEQARLETAAWRKEQETKARRQIAARLSTADLEQQQEVAKERAAQIKAFGEYVSSLGTAAYETLIGKTKEQSTTEDPETQQRELGNKLNAYFEDIFAEELLKELDTLKTTEESGPQKVWSWKFWTKTTSIKTLMQDAFKNIGEKLEDRFKNASSSTNRPEIMNTFSDYTSQQTLARMGKELKKLADQKKKELTDNNLWRILDSFVIKAQKVIQKGSDHLIEASNDWTFDLEL